MARIQANRHILTRIWCVLALVLLSFAHTPVDISSPLLQVTTNSGTASDPVFIRYETMPDGSIVSICVSENSADAGDHHQSHHMMRDCEACRISSGFALALPPETGGPVVAREHSSRIKHVAIVLPRSHHYPPSAPPQAPPALA